MSQSETRWKLPDWHHRRIAWRIECMSIKDTVFESYGLSGNMPLEQDIINDPNIKTLYSHRRSTSDSELVPFVPDIWEPSVRKPETFPVHRRSSCLIRGTYYPYFDKE